MKIVTHDWIFHADDVFAMAMLRRMYAPLRIVRTRDMSEVEEGDFVIDVGGEYDPARNRFDHHHSQEAQAG